MKNIIVLLVLLCSFSGMFAQEKEMTRKERRAYEKEKKKEEERKMDAQQAALIKVAIDSANWVLEADMLFNKRGASVNVSPTLNFVGLSGDVATVQLGSQTGLGYNGVGGVTLDGRISKYEVEYNEKKKNYFITVIVNSTIGTYDIRMNCNDTGTAVDATIKGNSSSSIRYSGRVVPSSMSSIYKGTTIF